jgi:hypothetical protein
MIDAGGSFAEKIALAAQEKLSQARLFPNVTGFDPHANAIICPIRRI